MTNECEHEWKYVDSYPVEDWIGYGIDAVLIEYGIAEYYCPKCHETMELEIQEEDE